jgi:hypothetical protein
MKLVAYWLEVSALVMAEANSEAMMVPARDFPMVQGGVLVVATLYVVVNACTDALAGVFDPRVRA